MRGRKKGHKHSQETIQKIRNSQLGKPRPYQSKEKHGMWKGDEVAYEGIHTWNNKYFPKQQICRHCGDTEKRHEWALLHGKKHKRGIENYIELCRKCHINYDQTEDWTRKNIESLKKTYSHQNPIQNKSCKHCSKQFKPRRKTTRFCSNSCSQKSRTHIIKERDRLGRIIKNTK